MFTWCGNKLALRSHLPYQDKALVSSFYFNYLFIGLVSKFSQIENWGLTMGTLGETQSRPYQLSCCFLPCCVNMKQNIWRCFQRESNHPSLFDYCDLVLKESRYVSWTTLIEREESVEENGLLFLSHYKCVTVCVMRVLWGLKLSLGKEKCLNKEHKRREKSPKVCSVDSFPLNSLPPSFPSLLSQSPLCS